MSNNSIMKYLYYKRIKAKLMTIDQVPSMWKDQVQDLIDNDKEGS